MSKFHLMRRTIDGKLSAIQGVRGEESIKALEDIVRLKNLRDTGNEIVIVEVVARVQVETHIRVEQIRNPTKTK